MLKTTLALAALSPLALLSTPTPPAVPQMPCPTAVRGDVDGDGQANIVDLTIFYRYLANNDPVADMNYDGQWDIADWVVFFDVYETDGLITLTNKKTPVDINLDGRVDIADLVVQGEHVFQTGSSLGNITRYHATPPQLDSSTDIADFIVYLDWYFAGCR